jgi:predicted enzyme related to lactoylglutathione lyase
MCAPGEKRKNPQMSVREVEFKSVAPVIPVLDLDAALERYRRLGFSSTRYSGPERYGFIERGDVQMHLSESADHDPKRTAATVYLHVSDADSVHSAWRESGVEGLFHEPFDTPYGLREFNYVDPDGTLHRVGSPLE